mmetsp:Transcript_19322/g.45198  ORF Transcript_19322/g.45198 Transcript_19322/m.45198 type:complete len:242 (+) Transcript_19322:359-1084(+)
MEVVSGSGGVRFAASGALEQQLANPQLRLNRTPVGGADVVGDGLVEVDGHTEALLEQRAQVEPAVGHALSRRLVAELPRRNEVLFLVRRQQQEAQVVLGTRVAPVCGLFVHHLGLVEVPGHALPFLVADPEVVHRGAVPALRRGSKASDSLVVAAAAVVHEAHVVESLGVALRRCFAVPTSRLPLVLLHPETMLVQVPKVCLRVRESLLGSAVEVLRSHLVVPDHLAMEAAKVVRGVEHAG